MFTEFFDRERKLVGWRFWLCWVAATNAGFFPGLALGERLGAPLGEPFSSAVVGGTFGALVGVAQWLVLRRHITRCHHWFTATAIGWFAGGGLGALILTSVLPNVSPGSFTWVLFIGFFAGAVVGIPHRRILLHRGAAVAAWWVPISSVAWGVFFPGAISGLFLARRLRGVA